MRFAVLVALSIAGCSKGIERAHQNAPTTTNEKPAPATPETNELLAFLGQTAEPEDPTDQQSEYKVILYTSETEERTIKMATCHGCHWVCNHCEPSN